MINQLLVELLREMAKNADLTAKQEENDGGAIPDPESAREAGFQSGFACGLGTAAQLIEKYLVPEKADSH